MYSFDSRIRYSECDSSCRLTMAALVNYLQDAVSFHSEDLGAGVSRYAENGNGWVLSAWQIVMDRMPQFCEKVKICTQPYDFKGFYGMRNFWIEDQQGNKLVKANSLWVYVDTKTGKPVKVSEQEINLYGFGDKLEMDYAPRKISVQTELLAAEKIEVHSHMIDTNNHVNNGQYIRIAEELLGYAKEAAADSTVYKGLTRITQIRAEYKKQAVLGDIMYPYYAFADNNFYVDLRDADGATYAIMEFTLGGLE